MKTADCHPQAKHFAKGKCRNCYMKEFKLRRPEYREYMSRYLKEYRKRPELQEHLANRRRDNKLARNYGLSLSAKHAMLDAQGGACKICITPLALNAAHVDHCHASGTVRGLLCMRCNTGLGLFGDSGELLRRAADYLSVGSKEKDATLSEIAKQP